MNQIMEDNLHIMNYTATFIYKLSNRFEFFQYWITIPYHVILIISFFLLILLHKHLPLKSKGLMPFYTCILLSNNTVRGYLANLPLNYLVNYNLCYIESFISYPNNISVVFITLLNYNKFISIQYINKRKEQFFKKKDGEIKETWFINLFKILNGQYFYTLLFIIAYLFQCFIQLIVLIITRFQCNPLQVILSTIGSLFGIFILIIVSIILFSFEIYLNFDNIKTCKFRKLFLSDPYYFRIETYIFALFCVVPLYVIQYNYISWNN